MAQELIPARRAVAVRVARGDALRVINTHGQQVIDAWAFVDAGEWMSMEHSRLHMGRVNPALGDTFVTNQRRPVLTLTEDTSGGVHDTLLAACDRSRYELLGAPDHDNCADNLHAALASVEVSVPCTPSPLNLFENAPPARDGTIAIAPPVSTPGSWVVLRAELDVLVVLSACPQDLAPTNGPGPADAHYELMPQG
ncbi:DUF1989 domain-containing protein [Solirubrobacter soli]|uniref:DUF1989 domain-containing protein n=1 Tax=Solirubrobacter soli TaxID=363832 RepID=UPI00041D5245|nr:urea carboxylase-associated family protein [Solirubrobacter soli]